MIITLHPKMTIAAVAEFLRQHELVVERISGYHTLPAGEEVPLLFTCERCEWTGMEPFFVDTQDAFNPPRGEIPQCPACSSFSVVFHLFGESPCPKIPKSP